MTVPSHRYAVGVAHTWRLGTESGTRRQCNYQANGSTCDPFDPTDEKGDGETPRSKYEDYYSNNRLDYVFVEKPKRAHELIVSALANYR